MNKHYFFSLPKDKLELLKKEYINSNIFLFTKKYNISNNSAIKLFGKKWMKWIVWRKIKMKPLINKKKFNTIDVLNNQFFNKWLYKNSIDPYYTVLFNRNK